MTDETAAPERLAPYGARTLDALFYTASVVFAVALFVPSLRDSYLLMWAALLPAIVIGVGWEVSVDG